MPIALNICFFAYFIATEKKRKISVCEISIIIILIYQKLESVEPVQQENKLPLPYHHGILNLGYVSII